MKAAPEEGSVEKHQVTKMKQEKRLDTLKFQKSKGGLFTVQREVDDNLARKNEMV